MDPLSVLGVAAAAVEFFNFSRSILKDYGEIRREGELLTSSTFEKTTTDLVELNAALQRLPRIAENSRSPLEINDEV
jgi:hypothetical protein